MCRISEGVLPASLPGFLQTQRWFGGKSRTLAGVLLVDQVWLRDEATPDLLAIVEVSYADAAPERYCLWLGFRDTPGDKPVIGRAAAGSWIVDVSADADSARALLQRLAACADLPTANGGALRFGDVTGEAAAILGGGPPVRSIAIDQSNTSLEVGGALVFKLFRRVQPGENPEVELGRFLTTRTTFRDFAPLHGSATYAGPDGTACTIGVLQQWVQHSGDGWRYVQGRLAGELDRPGTWDTVRDDLFTLGAITAAFHQASASDSTLPAFAPVPIGPGDVRNWTAAVIGQAAQAVRHLQDSALAREEQARLAGALARVGSSDALLVPSVEAPATSFCSIRIHGDYHLGQTLKTKAGFALIDFEGEPTRTIEERRRKQCALKDVAGMLRSFEYALAVAGAGAPDRVSSLRTELAMAPGFLEGYFSAEGMSSAAFLPADRGACAQWIRFFEIEKALYELDYELNNRPAWCHIPARGLLRLLDD